MKMSKRKNRLELRRRQFDSAKRDPNADDRYSNGGFHRPGSLKK